MNAEDYENVLNGTRKVIVVGVVGSRRRNSIEDFNLLDSYVISLRRRAYKSNSDLEFVSGGCAEGADYFITKLCRKYDLKLTEHLPQLQGFSDYFKKVQAYYARNKLIAEDCNFLIAMAAHDRTGGTENTIGYTEKLGKKVILI